MARKRNSRLTLAFQNALLVRFSTPYEAETIEGYILDMGPEFFLLGVVDNDVRFNGFLCAPISDIKKLRVPAPYAEFIVAALRKRGGSIDKKPNIKLDSLPELLRSANRLFPLVTINRERVRPGVCEIGRVVEISKSHLFLREIDPGAVWEGKATKIRLRDITQVEFGGAYEEALHLVGGKPKPLAKPRIRAKL
jgi:hypothetical protein